jgi:hypothetical protein
MPQIKLETSKNKIVYRTEDGKNRWEPFKDEKHIQLVKEAFLMIDTRILKNKATLKTCNAAFVKLKGRRDFPTVWKMAGIWVSFNPNPEEGLYGWLYKNDISLSAHMFAMRNPVPWIAGTLIHELAHVNGAPGGPDTSSKEAEGTLPPCGFDDVHNPATVGDRMRRYPTQVGVA